MRIGTTCTRPRNFGGYPESLDWLDFRSDNAFRLMKWRTDLIRNLDPAHKLIAHGVAGTLDTLPSNTHNEWRSAELVDTWGLTWIAARKGNDFGSSFTRSIWCGPARAASRSGTPKRRPARSGCSRRC